MADADIATAKGPKERVEWAAQALEFPVKDTPPFRLVADVSIRNGDETLTGTYTLLRASETQWREEILVKDYEEIHVVRGDETTWFRNIGYRPAVILELRSVLRYAQNLDSAFDRKFGKFKTRNITGIDGSKQPSQCTRIRDPKGHTRGSAKRACFDPESGHLTSMHSFDKVYTFEGFQPAGDRWLPTKVHKWVKRGVEVTVTYREVQWLDSPIDDDAWTLDREGARTWGWCPKDQMTPPRPHSELPILNVAVNIELDREGQVTRVHIAGRGATYDSARLHKRVRALRFDPALCNGEPVEAEFSFFSSVERIF